MVGVVAVRRGVDGLIVIQGLQPGSLLCLLERQSLSFASLSEQLCLFDKAQRAEEASKSMLHFWGKCAISIHVVEPTELGIECPAAAQTAAAAVRVMRRVDVVT